MKKSKMKMILVTVSILMLSISVIGCAKNSETTGNPSSDSKNFTVTLAGSTSVYEVAEPLAQAFEEKYSNSSIEVQGGGSTTGVTQAISRAADIGMASRELKESEKGQGLVEHKIAVDGIAIVINSDNPVTDLTIEQIKGLFTGTITNWKEVGGKDLPVVVVSREPGSGTRGAFEEILKIDDMVLETIVSDSTGGVRTTVSGNENSIGYISTGALEFSVKALKVNGVECTTSNISSGSYPISRPFLMLTNGQPDSNTQMFLDFVFSEEGQNIIEDKGYVRVN